MKKLFAAAMLAVLIPGTACAAEHKVGDILGDVYNTDIITLLDGVAIPSYALDGTTAIALADLRNYGFTVTFDENTRRVDVTTDLKPAVYNTPEISRGSVGGIYGHILYTDIVAYVNGVLCPSYNVDGNTCVRVETLGELTDEYNQEWGYSDYNFNYSYDNSVRTLYLNAYRFPAVTYEEAVAENAAFSDTTELELYTTGSAGLTYSGAKFEPASGVYAGLIADEIEGFTTTFGVYSSYFEFDEKISRFRKIYSETLEGKDNINLIPWNTSDVSQVFDNDEYIRQTLDTISATGKNSIIRFAAEMNCSGIGDSPSMYVKAFRHIADIVHEYDNLAVMWSPNDYGALNRPYEIYYPGDEYVDWIGISCFIKHDFLGDTSYDDNALKAFGCGDYAWTSNSLKKIIDFMARNGIDKPVAISEGAVESAVHYADINLDGWAQPRLRAMYWYTAMKFPQVKMVVYFNQNCGGEVMDYKVTDEYIGIIEEAIKGAGYMTTASDTPSVTFTRAENAVYTDTLPLYTYAYFPHNTITSVEYLIDGTAAASAKDIPYQAEIDLSALSKETHTLTIKVVSADTSFTYDYSLTYNNGWKLSGNI